MRCGCFDGGLYVEDVVGGDEVVVVDECRIEVEGVGRNVEEEWWVF